MMNRNRVLMVVAVVAVSVLFLTLAASAGAATENKPPKEKLVLIHYKDGTVKPASPGKGGNSQTYTFLVKGAKWKTFPVNYVINPTNEDGLADDFIASAMSKAAEEWDAHTTAELFGLSSIDLTATYDGNGYADERNEIVFGAYPNSNVIAVTSVWGYFSGPVQAREIVEMDILLNDYYVWGDATFNSAVMDLQNIATHEIGHGAGLGDLYNSSAIEETMYGYSTQGEIKKRTLNPGDITGIGLLYGI